MILKIYIIITFLYCLLASKNTLLKIILSVSAFNTVLTNVLLYYGKSIGFNNKVYVIVHFLLWLYLLRSTVHHKKLLSNGLLIFISIVLFDFIFIEDFKHFYLDNIFISGTFIYIVLFLYESFYQLQKENLSFFKTNDFILIFSPIFFFIGFSFVFVFKNRELNDTLLFNNIKLYTFISYFVNIIYYLLVSLYIYKEQKTKND